MSKVYVYRKPHAPGYAEAVRVGNNPHDKDAVRQLVAAAGGLDGAIRRLYQQGLEYFRAVSIAASVVSARDRLEWCKEEWPSPFRVRLEEILEAESELDVLARDRDRLHYGPRSPDRDEVRKAKERWVSQAEFLDELRRRRDARKAWEACGVPPVKWTEVAP